MVLNLTFNCKPLIFIPGYERAEDEKERKRKQPPGDWRASPDSSIRVAALFMLPFKLIHNDWASQRIQVCPSTGSLGRGNNRNSFNYFKIITRRRDGISIAGQELVGHTGLTDRQKDTHTNQPPRSKFYYDDYDNDNTLVRLKLSKHTHIRLCLGLRRRCWCFVITCPVVQLLSRWPSTWWSSSVPVKLIHFRL